MTPSAVKEKDQLARIEAELNEKRDERAAAQKELDSARETFADSEAPLSQDSDEFQAVKTARGNVGEIDDRIAELQLMQVELLKAAGKAPKSERDDRPSGNPNDPRDDGWNAAEMLAGDEVKAMLATFASASTKMGRHAIGEVASRDAFAADVVGSTASRKGSFQGIQPQLRRALNVLDLIPKGTMDNNTFPYTQEGGAFTGPAETDEGTAKPEAAVTFTDAEATARTIAAWLKLQKQSLEDVPALRAIIESRLRYAVERRLEAQILNGNGTPPNLRGILQTSGIGAVGPVTTQESSDTVLDGITTVLLADARATGIIMHPSDWSASLKSKASGDGQYFSGGPYSVTPQTMWGVPLIPSAALTQGTSLVGDFEIGALLLIRSGLQVLLSDSDQNDFLLNRVTLLAELRAALPVFRPAAFCAVTL